ncbi:hypothetical protein SESBI_26969 [Sesbania bispinosa]|nr:hypothetical protein SESBI_26969 [Sesbania bispinosa]
MENCCGCQVTCDADVLLPSSGSGLLAGLKKQSSDGEAGYCCGLAAAAVSINGCWLRILLSSHSNNPNLTPEEVVVGLKSSKPVNATKAAKVARAAAEEKAEIAAKANGVLPRVL